MDIWVVFKGFVVVLQLQTILVWTFLYMTCLLLQICKNVSREYNEEPNRWVPGYEYVQFRWVNTKVYPKVVILAFFSLSHRRSAHVFSWTILGFVLLKFDFRVYMKYMILIIIFLISKWARAYSTCLGVAHVSFPEKWSNFLLIFLFFNLFLIDSFLIESWIMSVLCFYSNFFCHHKCCKYMLLIYGLTFYSLWHILIDEIKFLILHRWVYQSLPLDLFFLYLIFF